MINAGTPAKPPSETPKDGGGGTNPKGGGGWWAGVLAIPFVPLIIKLIPFIVSLIVFIITKNGFLALSLLLGLGAWLWNIRGGWKTTLIVFACIFFIFGIAKNQITQLSIVYGKSIGVSIVSGWKSVTRGISCAWCQATTGAMNPAACEEKCELGLESTEQLLEITYEAPGLVSQGMPISFDMKIKLLAEEETVKNLAIDIWVVNETDCVGDYCIPEEMFVCPKKAECVKIVEMDCGDGVQCDCQNDLCELNKVNSEKNPIVWIYNPTCHGKKDITLFPQMKTQYEFAAKTFYKVRVAKSESKSPGQNEEKIIGPLSIRMDSDKDVYILEKMPDNLRTGNLRFKVTNTGDGFAYIKSVLIKQEHAGSVGSFEIVECPGFNVEQTDGNFELSLEGEKTLRLGPRDQWTTINCIMNVPSEGITKFNEYTFSAYVTYQYKEEKSLAPIFIDCGEKKG